MMTFNLKFISKVQVAPHAFTFLFEREDKLNYFPGQYMRIVLPHNQVDDWGTSRFFTISSSPSEKEHITITTTKGKSSFKQILFALKEGDDIQAFGPMGTMFIRDDATEPHIFLAGGMGITPFRSMIRFAADKGLKIPITLIVSWRSQEQMVFHQELEEIAKQNTWFTYIPTITSDVSKEVWQGARGRVTKDFIHNTLYKIQNTNFFITGVSEMVDSMRDIVQSLRVSEENIKTEVFTIIE